MQFCYNDQTANFYILLPLTYTEASGFDPASCVPVSGPVAGPTSVGVGTMSVDQDDASTKADNTGSSGGNGFTAVIGLLATASAAVLGMVM